MSVKNGHSRTIPLLTLCPSAYLSVCSQTEPSYSFSILCPNCSFPTSYSQKFCGAVSMDRFESCTQAQEQIASKSSSYSPAGRVPVRRTSWFQNCVFHLQQGAKPSAHTCEVLLQSKRLFTKDINGSWKNTLRFLCTKKTSNVLQQFYTHFSHNFSTLLFFPLFHKTRKAVNMLTVLIGSVSNYRLIFWKRFPWMNFSVLNIELKID